jgi:hypothetical protein
MTLMTLLHLSTVRTLPKTTLYTVYMGASVISVMEANGRDAGSAAQCSHKPAYNPNCKTSGHKSGHNRRMIVNNNMKTNGLYTYSPSVTNRLMLKYPVNTRFLR